MNEKHRFFAVFHLPQGAGLAEGVASPQLGDAAGRVKDGEFRQAEPQLQLAGKDVPDARVAAVLDEDFHAFGRVLTRRHHRGGRPHRDAMDDNLRLRVIREDEIDPAQYVLTVQPPHAYIVALALAAGPQVGCDHLIASFIIGRCQLQRACVVTAVAVQNNRPAVCIGGLGVGIADAMQGQAISGGECHVVSRMGSCEGVDVRAVLCAVRLNDCLDAVRRGFDLQRDFTIAAVSAAADGIVYKVVADKQQRRRQHHDHRTDCDDDFLFRAHFCFCFQGVFPFCPSMTYQQ